VYNLSASKTTNQFIDDASKNRKSLRYNKDFRRRIELIQDFDFPVASSRVKMTPDQKYIIATGVYPPSVKIYETAELSMKCMRGIDAEVVNFCILGSDYSKLVFICDDRTLEFHAQYGRHYKTRIPKPPRDLCYHPHTCDLFVGASSSEIYRMSLDEGKFLSPFESDSPGINVVRYNPYLNLLHSGGEEGIIESWDYRERTKINKIIANDGSDITAMNHDSSGYIFAVGSANGLVRLYDLRYSSHTLEVQHPYRDPIKAIGFHEDTKSMYSADRRMLKIYNKNNGKVFTNVEPKNEINDVEFCAGGGLILLANEDVRVGTLFIPELGPAPGWCNFMENITEELEEEANATVYDEYKFLTAEDLEKLNSSHLIGGKFLKRYMHGYLMKMKMYNKLREVQDPFAYEEYRKKQIEKKLEEQRSNRIILTKKKNNDKKVNQSLVDELKKKSEKKKAGPNPMDILKDDRFKRMFEDENWKVDPENEAYLARNPKGKNKKKQEDDFDSVSEEEAKAPVVKYRQESESSAGEEEARPQGSDNDDDYLDIVEKRKKISKVDYESKMQYDNQRDFGGGRRGRGGRGGRGRGGSSDRGGFDRGSRGRSGDRGFGGGRGRGGSGDRGGFDRGSRGGSGERGFSRGRGRGGPKKDSFFK